MKTTFQILDAYAQDLEIQVETDTTREVAYIGAESDDDGEVRSRRRARAPLPKTTKRKRMIIHLFGTSAEGKSVRANIEGFEPFFYVRLPFDTKSGQQEFKQRIELLVKASCDYSLKLATGELDFEITFCKKKMLFGYTAGAQFPFACLKVRSIAAWRALRSYFLEKETSRPIFELFKGQGALEVFEANLDPMLRFFHLRNIQPCGWVSTDLELDEFDSDMQQINCHWEDITPCTKPPLPVAPFCLASWDIECYSENGEFPLPKKTYERIAKLLFAGARDGAHAADLIRSAALYPENPPDGMDGLYHRNGQPVNRKALDTLMESTFQSDLDTVLKGREGLVGTSRDEKVKEIHALLKKTIERVLPLAGDPVIQIGVVLQRGGCGQERHIFVLGSCDPVEGATLYTYETERELILGWAKALCQWNTDILLGYNIFGFDERYVWIRAEELGIAESEEIQLLTRLQDTGKSFTLEEKFLSSSALGDNTMYIWTAQGRLQIDLYHYVKRSYALASYKLDDVCQHFMSGSLKGVEVGPETWTIKTKTTADVIPGRSIVLLDETGDALVEKLKVVHVNKNSEIIVELPADADDLVAVVGAAVKWVMVKDDISPQEIFKLHRGTAADRSKVAAYCVQDCVLVLDLYKKLDVFNNAMAMANACSVPVGYIFTRGQGIKIESLIFKECHERGQLIKVLESSRQSDDTPAESYEGAIVLDPIPGFYFDSPIGVADFASLYPSTIISENISYDTLVWVKNYSLTGKFNGFDFGAEVVDPDPAVRWTDIEFDIWGSDPEDKRKHPAKIKTGLRICRFAQLPGNTKGALPDIVQKLLAARKAKRKEGAAETDPFKKALLDAEQLAYKLTANSLYGQLGSATFKIRLQHLAASVTAYGRKQIMFAKAAIERFYGPAAQDPRCSAVTVYGDTDSLFVNFNARNPETGETLTGQAAIEATMHLTEEAGKFVSRCLKPPHDFEYDKVFSPFIIFSKKRYVGNKYEESPTDYYQNSMGIATKRRDYAPIVKLIYGGALQILLTKKNIPEALGFVKEKLKELVDAKMSLNMLTMSKSLRAEYASATPPAHKVLAERIKERDPGNAPASGERVPFIYVLPPVGQLASKLQGERVETPTFIKEKGLKPDYRFYIEHQLMNPINQLFALVAEKIPGVVMPRGGWSAATEADRLNATSAAIFDEILGVCDKSAGRRFAEKFFAGATISSSPAKPRLTKTAVTTAAAPKQTTMNTYFIDKMIIKAIDTDKKKKSSKKAGPNTVDK
uniref:DNA-directed DNA polymerase n=1 Tax=viral metagenome TaxID=1070528 RepID=A0A6C0JXQ5_9ZZZZ